MEKKKDREKKPHIPASNSISQMMTIGDTYFEITDSLIVDLRVRLPSIVRYQLLYFSTLFKSVLH